MKAIKIIVVLIVVGTFINWARSGADWPLPQALPFLSGQPISALYEVAGLVMIGIGLWGLGRLRSGND